MMLLKHTTNVGCLLLCILTTTAAQDNIFSIAASLFNQVPTSAYGGIISAAQSVYSQAIATSSSTGPTTSAVIYSTPTPSSSIISIPSSTSSFTTPSSVTLATTSSSSSTFMTTATSSASSTQISSTTSSTPSAAQASNTAVAASTSTASGHHIGNGAIIALAVVCGLFGLGLILAIVYLCRRRAKKARQAIGTDDIETWRLGTSRSRRSNSKHYSDQSSSSGGFVPIPLPSANMMETSYNRRQPSSLTRFSSRTNAGDDSIVSPIEPDVVPTWARSKSKRVPQTAIEEEREPEHDTIGSPTSPAEVEGSSIPWIAQKMSKMVRHHHQHQHQQQQQQQQQTQQQTQQEMPLQQVIYPSRNEASSFDFGLVDNSQAAPGRTSDTFTIPRRPIRS